MAYKAHRHLLNTCGLDTDKDVIARDLGLTTAYNAVVGNSYTASMYLGLAALLDQADDLTDRAVGFLSYGSGSVAEFFAGTVVPGYREQLRTAAHREVIDRRKPLDYAALPRAPRALLPGRRRRPPHARPRPPAPSGWPRSAATSASTRPASRNLAAGDRPRGRGHAGGTGTAGSARGAHRSSRPGRGSSSRGPGRVPVSTHDRGVRRDGPEPVTVGPSTLRTREVRGQPLRAARVRVSHGRAPAGVSHSQSTTM